MKKIIIAFTLIVLSLVSCEKEPTPIPVTGISLDATSLMMTEGESAKLIATISPSNADNQGVIWSSSNASVATVSNGTISAVAAGTATITAKADDGGKTATCNVTVNPMIIPVASISLSKSSLELTEEEAFHLNAVILPSNATNQNVIWKSSDESVAIVTGGGDVIALNAGETRISVISEDGGKQAECIVTVLAKYVPVSAIALNITSTHIFDDDSLRLSATIYPENATNKSVIWSSSNSAVAVVENGLVRAIQEGETIITVVADDNGLSAECYLSVENSKISFIDKYVKAVCVQKYDANGDGELSYKEASEVRNISSNFFGNYKTGVKCFDELQYFTGLTVIPRSAFENCEELVSVRLPDSIIEIGPYAFGWCHKLKSINLPNRLQYIREYGLFATSLEEIVLPDSLVSIEDSGIAANNISTITIPDSVTSLGYGFLRECNSLKTIFGKYASEDNRCVVKDGVLYAFAPAEIEEYTTPNETRIIGRASFSGCKNPKKLIINEGVTELQGAFEWSDIPNILVIPSTMLVISSRGSASEIYCKAEEPPILNCSASPTVYVPEQSVSKYQQAKNWQNARIVGVQF